MSLKNLTPDELAKLLQSVFDLKSNDMSLSILVDLPNDKLPDSSSWADRRAVANEWYHAITAERDQLPFEGIRLYQYENVGSNNNDLPNLLALVSSNLTDDRLHIGANIPLEQVLSTSSVVLALTELSATAPLKNLARRLGFRGATLPGFSREMMPALRLDYTKVHERVMRFKERLDRAASGTVVFTADRQEFVLNIDLRHRLAHASGGLMRENGVVGNLPSGEAYIVPYEGEIAGDPSNTSGELPVQFGNEVVTYRVHQNRAVGILTQGPASISERRKLELEPAYGNISELGLGVLSEWGVTPVGSILLDEKLGLHIAFGRSEHFGGVTGPTAFTDPKNVIHIDRVYVPESQPRISISSFKLGYPDGATEEIMSAGKYLV